MIDYLWGTVAETAIAAIFAKRKNLSQQLDWIQIGNEGEERGSESGQGGR